MNILFICSANKDRSATAEQFALKQYPTHQYDAAGTNQRTCFQLGTNYISLAQMNWADLIYAMENKHKKELLKLFGSGYGKKIKVLGIKDYYAFGDSDLIEILKEKFKEIL